MARCRGRRDDAALAHAPPADRPREGSRPRREGEDLHRHGTHERDRHDDRGDAREGRRARGARVPHGEARAGAGGLVELYGIRAAQLRGDAPGPRLA